MSKKKPDWQQRVEVVLKLSLALQREILATDKLILAAILKAADNGVTIIPGSPRYKCKSEDSSRLPLVQHDTH